MDRMVDHDAYATLRANTGKQVQIVLGGQQVSVLVVSVDPDGALFRPTGSELNDAASEFWVAFDHIDTIQLRRPAAN